MKVKEESIIFPRPTPEILSRKEKRWHVALPDAYKDFLTCYNGSVPENRVFDCGSNDYVVTRFLGLVDDYQNNDLGIFDIGVVETQIGERLSANEDLVGMDMVPIAVLFAGDFLCLDFRETPDHPTVCVWYHEESGVFDPATEKVADSFEEFLEMLHS